MKLLALFAAILIIVSAPVAAQTNSSKVDEQAIPARDGAKVFGLVLGRDTLKDVEVKVHHPDGSICKIDSSKEECRPTYEIKTSGYLSHRGNSLYVSKYSEVSPSSAELLFAKFSIDGEHLTGTFFKNTLIALSVNNKYGDDLDSSVDAASLRASFDKKYKKQGPPFVKTSTDDGITDKYTYLQWRDSTGTFDIQLTRHDSILVNKAACLQHLRTFLSISQGMYDRSKHLCEGSFFNYQLDYRATEMYVQAFDLTRKLEAAEKTKKKNASTDRVNKY